MSRMVLTNEQVSAEAQKVIGSYHAAVVQEVASAVAKEKIVVVGMAHNPFVIKARKALKAAGKNYKYLEYGNYFSMWKPRLAIKLWSGWPTFPQVFVDGKLIGGFTDLKRLMDQGGLK